jgi:hypothetical protein
MRPVTTSIVGHNNVPDFKSCTMHFDILSHDPCRWPFIDPLLVWPLRE